MRDSEQRIPDDIAPKVLEIAARYYADAEQSFSASDLVAAGNEVKIPEKFIRQAIQDVQEQQRLASEEQKRNQQKRRRALQASTGVVVLILLWSTWTYNYFAHSKAQVEASWAQVENQLQRRADLLPNLITVSQAVAEKEQTLIATLISAREGYLQAKTPEEKALSMQKIDRAIEDFYAYATANPQLRSSQVFTNLLYEIAGTENRLAVERRRYNQAVQNYNQSIHIFPNLLIAKAFDFQDEEFFQAE